MSSFISSTLISLPFSNVPSFVSNSVPVASSFTEQGITSLAVSPQRLHLPSLRPVSLIVGSFITVGFSKSWPKGEVFLVSVAPQALHFLSCIPSSVHVGAFVSDQLSLRTYGLRV